MEENTQLPKEYNPSICNHKRPNGFTAWQMQSESSGSGPDFDEHVTICVCVLCGDIKISGRKWDSESKQTNRFNETFHVYVPDAIDAIVKQANFYNEEAKWSRIDTAYATKLHQAETYNGLLKNEIQHLNTVIENLKARPSAVSPALTDILRFKAGAAEYFMQHNYRELYGLLQKIFELAENAVKEIRTWHTDKEMYNHLRLKGYSHEIAEELSKDYATNLQGAYQKGLQHAQQAEASETIKELERQNEKLKATSAGWRPLLEKVLVMNEMWGDLPGEFINEVKSFLYGE